MNRRSFFAMLGLAPVAAVASPRHEPLKAGYIAQIDVRSASEGVAEQIRAALQEHDRTMPQRLREAQRRGLI